MNENYLLHKYLNGEATPEEISVLKASSEYVDFLEIAEASATFEVPEFDSERIFDAIQKKKEKRLSSNNRDFSRFLKIAAVFAVLISGYLFVSQMGTTVETGIAEKKEFSLPDQSIVQLNAKSSIRYKKKGWNNNRELKLDGEAYFKVSKGNTFQVVTEQGTVSVLGTQFNVFSRDTIFNIKCFEGLVSVAFNDTLVKLPAGNKLKIENNKLVVYTQTNSTKPTWIDKESSFENASLATVLNELEYQYNIVVTSPEDILKKRFTGSISHDNLELALRSICDPLRLTFEISGNVVTIYAQNQE